MRRWSPVRLPREVRLLLLTSSTGLCVWDPGQGLEACLKHVAAPVCPGPFPGRQVEGPEFSIFVGDLANDVTDLLLAQTFRTRYPSVKGAKVRRACLLRLPGLAVPWQHKLWHFGHGVCRDRGWPMYRLSPPSTEVGDFLSLHLLSQNARDAMLHA